MPSNPRTQGYIKITAEASKNLVSGVFFVADSGPALRIMEERPGNEQIKNARLGIS